MARRLYFFPVVSALLTWGFYCLATSMAFEIRRMDGVADALPFLVQSFGMMIWLLCYTLPVWILLVLARLLGAREGVLGTRWFVWEYGVVVSLGGLIVLANAAPGHGVEKLLVHAVAYGLSAWVGWGVMRR